MRPPSLSLPEFGFRNKILVVFFFGENSLQKKLLDRDEQIKDTFYSLSGSSS